MSNSFPVHLLEEHSSSLPLWWQDQQRQAGGAPQTIVYLDAHLDLQQIDPSQIQALKNANNIEEFTALESPHHLNPSAKYAFGIENFLFAASELGLIDRLIWVMPPHIPRHYNARLIDYIQQMDGVSFEELCSFKSAGKGALRGRLLGLDITLCDYECLHSLSLQAGYYLDIDIDYFVNVPDDQLWIDPAIVIQSIQKQIGSPQFATISRAIGSGFTPLPMYFIGDYCRALLDGDKADQRHYQTLYQALAAIDHQQAAATIELCEQALALRPDSAAAQFILAMAFDLGSARDRAKAARRCAIERNHVYAFNPARAASGFPNRHRRPDDSQISALQSQIDKTANGYETESKDSAAEIALALLYADRGALKPAWQLMQDQPGEFSAHPQLALAIARGILASAEPHKAIGLLELAAGAYATRSSATMLLGDLADHQGDTGQALAYYRRVSDYTPAWTLPLQQQARCLTQSGSDRPADDLQQQIHNRQQMLASLIKPDTIAS